MVPACFYFEGFCTKLIIIISSFVILNVFGVVYYVAKYVINKDLYANFFMKIEVILTKNFGRMNVLYKI